MPGRPCKSGHYENMELDESGSYKNLGKRPAGAGLFISFGDGREASPDSSYCLVCPAGKGRGWMGLTSRTTISAHEAFSDKEGDGRSWGINNTSNLSGVE